MAIRLPGIITNAKNILRQSNSSAKKAASSFVDVPKGHLAIYVGESQKKRFVVPVSLLNQPSFQELLGKVDWLRKNLDLIIQWAASQSPAAKTFSFISLLAYIDCCKMGQ
jgi:SAUR family protein